METLERIFRIETNKQLSKKYTRISLADYHWSYFMNDNLLFEIKYYLYHLKNQIDLITIEGDLAYSSTYLKKRRLEKLKNELRELADLANAPIYISLGNHDTETQVEKVRDNFKNLECDTIHPLDNEQVLINDEYSVTGFTSSYDCYQIDNQVEKAGLLYSMQFLDQIEKGNFEFDDDKYNMLMYHAPHPAASLQAQFRLDDYYERIDEISSGHLHGGFITAENTYNMNCFNPQDDSGYWEHPGFNSRFFIFERTNLCRGVHLLNNGKTRLIVSEGINRFNGLVPSTFYTVPIFTRVDVVPTKNKRLTIESNLNCL